MKLAVPRKSEKILRKQVLLLWLHDTWSRRERRRAWNQWLGRATDNFAETAILWFPTLSSLNISKAAKRRYHRLYTVLQLWHRSSRKWLLQEATGICFLCRHLKPDLCGNFSSAKWTGGLWLYQAFHYLSTCADTLAKKRAKGTKQCTWTLLPPWPILLWHNTTGGHQRMC